MNDLDILRDMANQLKLSTLKTSIMKLNKEAKHTKNFFLRY